jgi:hypothetical protein
MVVQMFDALPRLSEAETAGLWTGYPCSHSGSYIGGILSPESFHDDVEWCVLTL